MNIRFDNVGTQRSWSSTAGRVVFGFSAIIVSLPVTPSRAADTDRPEKITEFQARSFVIRDAKGRERASLRFSPRNEKSPKYSSPALQLLGSDGQVRFEFGLDDEQDAPVLRVLRADGRMAMFISSDKEGNTVAFEPRGKKQPPILLQTWRSPNGKGDGGSMEFYNAQGMPQVGLAVWPDDSPGMRLYDPNGKPFEPGNPPKAAATEPKASISELPTRRTSPVAKSSAQEPPVLEADAFQLVDDQKRLRAVFKRVQDADAPCKGAALIFFDLKGTPRAAWASTRAATCAAMTLYDAAGHLAQELQVNPDGSMMLLSTSQQEKSLGVYVTNPREGKRRNKRRQSHGNRRQSEGNFW